jgi:hypothetical protein
MKTYVEFRADQFVACKSEDCEINPGRHGKRLAEFLAAGLRARGFQTTELTPEDWGWVIPVENDDFKLWIGCGNNEEHLDGFLCFIEPHTPVIRNLFKKIDTRVRVGAVQQAMDATLSESVGIRDKKWWTHEEYTMHTLEEASRESEPQSL